jgi:hypothetical protein
MNNDTNSKLAIIIALLTPRFTLRLDRLRPIDERSIYVMHIMVGWLGFSVCITLSCANSI